MEKLDKKSFSCDLNTKFFPLCSGGRRRGEAMEKHRKRGEMCSPFIMSTVEIVLRAQAMELRPNISFAYTCSQHSSAESRS